MTGTVATALRGHGTINMATQSRGHGTPKLMMSLSASGGNLP
jgi:hypothetical protein